MIKCSVCGVEFDPMNLAQVFYHEVHKPIVAPTWSAAIETKLEGK